MDLKTVAVLLLLPVFLVFARPGSGAAQGLKLKETEEKVLETFDRPNPHFAFACAECHDGTPVYGVDTAGSVRFVNGDAGNVDLCYRCHSAADNIHPINKDPQASAPPIAVPDSLPLETRGDHRGSVVCSSCHFIHSQIGRAHV